ncbi:MAG: hypothetical protein ABS949_00810 [Solibacillus sp.]
MQELISATGDAFRGHGSNYFFCCHTAQQKKGFSARAVPAGVAPSAPINSVLVEVLLFYAAIKRWSLKYRFSYYFK